MTDTTHAPGTPNGTPNGAAPMSADGAPDPALLRFARGGARDEKTRRRLAEAVPADCFTYPGGLTAREHQALTYERLRRAGLAAPPAAELLDDPPLLCALLERAAIADPALFHVTMLHYTLAYGPVLRFGAGRDGPGGPAGGAAGAALASMDSFGTLLMTEVGRSNSHLSPRTIARHDPATGGFVLTTPDAAAAKFPTNTAHPALPKTAAVYATLEHGGRERGVFVFMVPLRGPGGRIADGARIVPAPETTGLQIDYGAVRLDGLRVPYEAWLRDGASIGPGGAFHDPAGSAAARLTRSMAIAPAVWRAVISASAAITRASAGMLLAHSAGRATLGRLAPRRALTDYRNQQEAVLGALASGYALTALAAHVQARRTSADAPGATAGGAAGDAGPDTAWAPWSAVDRDLALLKAAATVQAAETVSACRVHSGAPGFAAVERLNAYRGLTHAYMNAGGDNELILYDTARAMADLDRYTPPPAEPGPPDGGDPASPAVWRWLAGETERRMRDRLAARVAAARDAGADAFTAWNDNLALAARTATAGADRITAEILGRALDTGPAALRPVLTLHALNRIDRRAADLLNEGVLPPGALDEVWAARRRVCDELAPRAGELAAAFDLPPEITAPTTFLAP
ncbi:acyl-CoA dehydrogenase family protein [Actinomadura algeriensis]|uniref:Acyl-CoA oxidase n=1 Tax=Actinomadura algeriensis TaxID=1679523 RepID=A0ABR9K0G3_9ACTN|nr:acyl-CoA dehydrogenase [Actinomadura algeriensis]MBE1536312.1 acyl-CoA oxidase [Actinomadura algeriensis]